MSRWERWAPAVVVLLFVAAALILSRGLTQEDWDGIKAINNGLLVARAGGPDIPLDVQRPPLGWLLMSPWLGWAFHRGGAAAALRTAHRLWPLYAGGLLAASFRFFRRLNAAPAALVLLLLMALNPILLQFAPFALLDVFAGLAVLGFLAAAWRYLQRPDARSLAWLALAYLLAFLSKYHLGLLILVPLACRPRRLAVSPLWLLPPAVYLAGVVFLALLIAWATGGRHPALPEAWREMAVNFKFNLLTRKQSHWYLYPLALLDQLGPGLLGLAAWGVWHWIRKDGETGLFLASALLIPYAALCFAIANKEARYALPFLPLVYAAIGRGLQAVLERLPPSPGLRRAALAGALALVPWQTCLAAARYLSSEPSVHTEVPWTLADRLAEETPAGGCVGWEAGDLGFPIATPLFRYEHTLIVGAPTFKFFARNPVVEYSEPSAPPRCARWVVPRDGAAGPRWEGPAIGRVFDDAGKLKWEIYPDRLGRADEK